MTDSNSECGKNRGLSGKANGPQWISNKNKQNKKKLVVDTGLHYKNETGVSYGVESLPGYFLAFLFLFSFFEVIFCPFGHYLNWIVDKRGQ